MDRVSHAWCRVCGGISEKSAMYRVAMAMRACCRRAQCKACVRTREPSKAWADPQSDDVTACHVTCGLGENFLVSPS